MNEFIDGVVASSTASKEALFARAKLGLFLKEGSTKGGRELYTEEVLSEHISKRNLAEFSNTLLSNLEGH